MSVFAVPDGQNAEDESLTHLKDLGLRWSEATSVFTFNIGSFTNEIAVW